MRAVEGDVVTVHWACMNENGEVLESSRASDEPTTFEVGTGDIVGNKLFEAFDEVVRGMALGEQVALKVCTHNFPTITGFLFNKKDLFSFQHHPSCCPPLA